MRAARGAGEPAAVERAVAEHDDLVVALCARGGRQVRRGCARQNDCHELHGVAVHAMPDGHTLKSRRAITITGSAPIKIEGGMLPLSGQMPRGLAAAVHRFLAAEPKWT